MFMYIHVYNYACVHVFFIYVSDTTTNKWIENKSTCSYLDFNLDNLNKV